MRLSLDELTLPHMRHICLIMSIRPTTQTAIIEAAFEVLNADPSASVSDVATRAGVGRATLHRYFSSRGALIKGLAVIALEEMDVAVSTATKDAQSYTEAFETMFRVLVPLGDRHGFLTQETLANDPETAAAFQRQKDGMFDLIDALKKEGLFASDVPTEWINQAFDYLLYAAWDSVKRSALTQTQATDLALKTLTNGLGKT